MFKHLRLTEMTKAVGAYIKLLKNRTRARSAQLKVPQTVNILFE